MSLAGGELRGPVARPIRKLQRSAELIMETGNLEHKPETEKKDEIDHG